MAYYKQFTYFDPLKGQAPHWPFSQSQNIIYRARALLRKRSLREVTIIAEDATYILEAFFDNEKDEAIRRIQHENRHELLDYTEDGRVYGFLDDAFDEFDIRTKENTKEIDALQEGFATYFDSTNVEVKDVEEYEYFAAMALWFVGDFIEKIDYQFDLQQMKYVKRTAREFSTVDLSMMGSVLLEAMEAVCYAEQLREVDRMRLRFDERLKAEREHATIAAKKASEEKWQANKAEEAKQKSENAKKMAALSQKNRNESKAAVLAEWDKEPLLQQLSNAKAGVRLSDWLGKQDLEYFEPRTVTEWISEHKKKIASP